MRRAVVLAALLLAGRAEAQVTVDVALNAEGDAFASRLGVTPAELAAQMQTLIDNAYGASDVDAFIRSFADATAFSMRGLGVDYASDPNSLVLGVGANVAVAAPERVNAMERPTSGLAANIAFMAGYNLSSRGAPRWTLFANGFHRNASTTSLRGGISSAGIHVQYRLVDPQRDDQAATKLLRWIGIDVTGGLEVTRWSLGVNDNIVTEMGIDGANGSGRVILDSTGTFDIRSTAGSIPLEVSTGIRIAMLVSVYVGGAVDLTVGQGSLATNLGGTLYAGDGIVIGTSTITGGGERGASPFAARMLAGAQLNLSKLKVYAQVNGSAIPAANVGFGIRGVL
jgi:hypothetical protein